MARERIRGQLHAERDEQLREPSVCSFVRAMEARRLYGDRIAVRWKSADVPQTTVRYEYLGKTLGLGTFQFGPQTVRELGILLAQSRRGQQVNSVFGEGVNPRLRKIRDGLNELGLPADELLRHGAPRLVYGLALVENLAEYLLGIDERPKYILPQRDAGAVTDHIVEEWRERWVSKRILRVDLLQRMANHRLVHPIRHGARVSLPRDVSGQRMLFEE